MDTCLGSTRDFLARVIDYREKSPRLVLGLFADTSAKGVDLALAELAGSDPAPEWKIVAFEHVLYPRVMRRRIWGAAQLPIGELVELDEELGHFFAEAVLSSLPRMRHRLAEIDLVGCHGQTIYPTPRAAARAHATLQIGQADILAEELELPVVSDFRGRDIAAGGRGGPLFALADLLLLRKPGETRALVHIGDLASVTWLPSDDSVPVAFEVGPGMLLIDALVRRWSQADPAVEEELRGGAEGYVLEDLLEQLLIHPLFGATAPVLGPDNVGENFVRRLLREHGHCPPEDLLATLAAASARRIARSLTGPTSQVPQPPVAVFASGRGSLHKDLMHFLEEALHPLPVQTTAPLGLPPEAKEAFTYALLAHQTLMGRPGNFPPATGARRMVSLGRISV